jgi:hypothetical protein
MLYLRKKPTGWILWADVPVQRGRNLLRKKRKVAQRLDQEEKEVA